VNTISLPFSIRLVVNEMGSIFSGFGIVISGTLNTGISVEALVDVSA